MFIVPKLNVFQINASMFIVPKLNVFQINASMFIVPKLNVPNKLLLCLLFLNLMYSK